jgi:hypothetical protein
MGISIDSSGSFLSIMVPIALAFACWLNISWEAQRYRFLPVLNAASRFSRADLERSCLLILGKQRSLWGAWQIFLQTLRQFWLQPRFCTHYRQFLSRKAIPNRGAAIAWLPGSGAGWQSTATCLLAC